MYEETCTYAAMRGNLDILIWLREQGCPWNGRTLFYARKHKHSDLYSWALSNGCPNDYASDDESESDFEEQSEDEGSNDSDQVHDEEGSKNLNVKTCLIPVKMAMFFMLMLMVLMAWTISFTA